MKILNYIKFFNSIRKIKKQDKIDLKNWLKNGLKLPPPEVVKHNIILKYVKKEKINSFVANEDYINERFAILKINFDKIFTIKNQNFFIDFEKNFKSITQNSIIWVDTQIFLQFKTNTLILEKITEFIKLISQTPQNHVVLWDNTHLFLHNANFPNLQELKTIFLQQKTFYSAMKTENNIFVMAPKL